MQDYAQGTYDKATPERKGPHDQFEELLDRFSDAIDRLEARLSPVLAPPSPEPGLVEAQAFQSALATQVSRLRDRLDRLDSLKNRIEL